jgi:hypothetical protein
MTYYVVTARYCGDDEDTVAIYEAANSDEAIKRMVDDLLQRVADDLEEDDDEETSPPPDPDEVYLMSVVECDTLPRILVGSEW